MAVEEFKLVHFSVSIKTTLLWKNYKQVVTSCSYLQSLKNSKSYIVIIFGVNILNYFYTLNDTTVISSYKMLQLFISYQGESNYLTAFKIILNYNIKCDIFITLWKTCAYHTKLLKYHAYIAGSHEIKIL